jgi:CcmD family protein
MRLRELFEPKQDATTAPEDNVDGALKTIGVAFGRFNPPTIGHEKLIKKAKEISTGGDFKIYPSRTQDTNKNPLDPASKVKYMKNILFNQITKSAEQPDLAGTGKFYVVVGVIAVLFLGIVSYMVSLDLKIKKLEKKLEDAEYTVSEDFVEENRMLPLDLFKLVNSCPRPNIFAPAILIALSKLGE